MTYHQGTIALTGMVSTPPTTLTQEQHMNAYQTETVIVLAMWIAVAVIIIVTSLCF